MINPPRVVLDTNVLVSAMLSRRGASYALLNLIESAAFAVCVSVPLVLEYEDALCRDVIKGRVTSSAVEAVLDYLCGVAEKHPVHYLWRPHLNDPKDDMVLELALAAGCKYIVTHNLRDFRIQTRGALRVLTPGEFLNLLKEAP